MAERRAIVALHALCCAAALLCTAGVAPAADAETSTGPAAPVSPVEEYFPDDYPFQPVLSPLVQAVEQELERTSRVDLRLGVRNELGFRLELVELFRSVAPRVAASAAEHGRDLTIRHEPDEVRERETARRIPRAERAPVVCEERAEDILGHVLDLLANVSAGGLRAVAEETAHHA